MPLPDNGADTPWPPPQLAPISPKLREWSTWYSGDVDELAEYYRIGQVDPALQPVVRSSQYGDGIVGRVARWFWGTPQAAGEKRTKLHVPVASDICTASADLLFSEEVTLAPRTAPGATEPDKTVADRLQAIMDANRIHDTFLAAADVAAGLGGVYLRGLVDLDVDPTAPISAPVHADSAVPEFSYGRLTAVTFWRVLSRDGGTWLRHLERHEVINGAGYVFHGLYRGTANKLGQKVPLAEHPDTAGISVNDQAAAPTGIDELDVTYVPNMLPNRRWRNNPVGSNLGRSDFDSIEPLMDALDETWTSWMRDIRLGRGRVIVPAWMLRPGQPGSPSTINMDQEVFVGMSAPPGEQAAFSQTMTVQQFDIRTTEHAETVKALLVQIFRGAGYSGQTFGVAEEAAPTATEVNSRDQRSEVTREKKSRYWTSALEAHGRVLLKLDAAHFRGPGGGVEVDVTFPASSKPSLEQQATSVQMLRSAKAASIDTAVRMAHPDWTAIEVNAEVGKIMAEESALRAASRPTVAVQAPGQADASQGASTAIADPQASGSETHPAPAGNAAGGR